MAVVLVIMINNAFLKSFSKGQHKLIFLFFKKIKHETALTPQDIDGVTAVSRLIEFQIFGHD